MTVHDPLARVERGVRILLALAIAALAVVAVAVLASLSGTPGSRPAQLAMASPGATGTFELMPMGNAHIPTSSACILCHGAGGEVKTIPAILHPVEGWRRCIECHADGALGRAAPGHDGIAEEECLSCHQAAEAGPAITQPHAALQGQRCLECHGSVAHLPSSMASTKETSCVLCHKAAALPPPSYPHAPDAKLSCGVCHKSAEVGALPIDHALRADTTCLLCHEIVVHGGSSPAGASAPASSVELLPTIPPP